MRNIINIIDQLILTESVGLANRRPGDRWDTPGGDEIVFADLACYPERGQFEDERLIMLDRSGVKQLREKINDHYDII